MVVGHTNVNLQDNIINLEKELKNKKFYNEPKYTENGMLILEVDSIAPIPTTTEIVENTIYSGAKIMSNYGGVIAVACYASGNIGLGIIIDGITIACDISLTVSKYKSGEISWMTAINEMASTVMITATGTNCGTNFAKAAERVVLNPKTTQMVSYCITDFVTQGISTLNDIIIGF